MNQSTTDPADQSKAKPAPYEERNLEDFKLITKNITFALEKIANDDSIPATEQSLADLAGCSRGTLRNRIWPLKRLKLIKEARQKKAVEKQAKKPTSRAPDDYQQIVSALIASRTEAASRFDQLQQLQADYKKLHRAKELVDAENKALREERIRLLNAITPPKAVTAQPSNVTQFPDRAQTGG